MSRCRVVEPYEPMCFNSTKPSDILVDSPATRQPEEKPMAADTFNDLLSPQVGNELAASHEYIAGAVWIGS